MPLNITSTEQLSGLPGVDALPAADPGVKEALAQSVIEKPTPLTGISFRKLEPKIQAGYNLAKFVLFIATGTIIAFVIYLFWIDHSVSKDVLEEYSAVSSPAMPNPDAVDLNLLQRYADDLAAARDQSTYVLNPDDSLNADAMVKALNQMMMLNDAQRNEAIACQPLPVDATRMEKLRRCLSRVLEVRQLVMEARAARSAKFAENALDHLATQRKAIHDFWLQAAQLVLLNLLLPLLTALFGYIFGTQSQKDPS